MRDQEWDSAAAELDALDLAELVLGLLGLDAMDGEAALGVVDEAEVLARLLDGDDVHEAGGEGDVGADLVVDLDEALHHDGAGLAVVEGVLEAVAQEDDQGQAVAQLVRTGRGARGVGSRQLVEKPVGGRAKALLVLLAGGIVSFGSRLVMLFFRFILSFRKLPSLRRCCFRKRQERREAFRIRIVQGELSARATYSPLPILSDCRLVYGGIWSVGVKSKSKTISNSQPGRGVAGRSIQKFCEARFFEPYAAKVGALDNTVKRGGWSVLDFDQCRSISTCLWGSCYRPAAVRLPNYGGPANGCFKGDGPNHVGEYGSNEDITGY